MVYIRPRSGSPWCAFRHLAPGYPQVGCLCTIVDPADLRQHFRGYVETDYSPLDRRLHEDLAADPRRKATGGGQRYVRVFSHHIQIDSPQPVFVAFGRPETRHGGPSEKVFEASRCLIADRDCEYVGTTYVYQLPIDTPPATRY